MEDQKKKNIILIVLAIIFFIVILTLGYFIFRSDNMKLQEDFKDDNINEVEETRSDSDILESLSAEPVEKTEEQKKEEAEVLESLSAPSQSDVSVLPEPEKAKAEKEVLDLLSAPAK